ncbi:MAG TPA: hypothetical protein GXZ82_13945 [Firmicutes bacterium]|nr:hypothetical protein [Bacillota bacterium]
MRIAKKGNQAGKPPVAEGLRGRLGKAVAEKLLFSGFGYFPTRCGLFE